MIILLSRVVVVVVKMISSLWSDYIKSAISIYIGSPVPPSFYDNTDDDDDKIVTMMTMMTMMMMTKIVMMMTMITMMMMMTVSLLEMCLIMLISIILVFKMLVIENIDIDNIDMGNFDHIWYTYWYLQWFCNDASFGIDICDDFVMEPVCNIDILLYKINLMMIFSMIL